MSLIEPVCFTIYEEIVAICGFVLELEHHVLQPFPSSVLQVLILLFCMGTYLNGF